MINLLAELTKFRISSLAALSAAAGFVLAARAFSPGMAAPVLGIFLLASGASALNHYQERGCDALMERTRMRPIPSGRISPGGALCVSLVSVLAGLAVLFLGSAPISAALGAFGVFWYNGVYTPLKKMSAFAAVPGSLVGSIPPLAGWTAGGGNSINLQIAAVALFFLVWQMPHFWLLALKHGADYEKAGLPCLTEVLSRGQISRMTCLWMMATSAIGTDLSLLAVVRTPVMGLILAGTSLWCVWRAVRLLQQPGGTESSARAFTAINAFVLVVIAVISLDSLMVSMPPAPP